VKFLLDAQLPLRLSQVFTQRGHEVIHTRWLPLENRTSDDTLRRLADREARVLVTKDADFVVSHLLTASPALLLHVTTGNISNSALASLISSHIEAIESAFESGSYVELTSTHLIVHSGSPPATSS
jgi:predicted nuclease of predicted toxin-antitoxin system